MNNVFFNCCVVEEQSGERLCAQIDKIYLINQIVQPEPSHSYTHLLHILYTLSKTKRERERERERERVKLSSLDEITGIILI